MSSSKSWAFQQIVLEKYAYLNVRFLKKFLILTDFFKTQKPHESEAFVF